MGAKKLSIAIAGTSIGGIQRCGAIAATFMLETSDCRIEETAP
jgi:hypothetical protein